GDHLVDGLGQASQLIVRVGDRQATVQPVRSDLFRPPPELIDGGQGTARQEVTSTDGHQKRQRAREEQSEQQLSRLAGEFFQRPAYLDDQRCARSLDRDTDAPPFYFFLCHIPIRGRLRQIARLRRRQNRVGQALAQEEERAVRSGDLEVEALVM